MKYFFFPVFLFSLHSFIFYCLGCLRSGTVGRVLLSSAWSSLLRARWTDNLRWSLSSPLRRLPRTLSTGRSCWIKWMKAFPDRSRFLSGKNLEWGEGKTKLFNCKSDLIIALSTYRGRVNLFKNIIHVQEVLIGFKKAIFLIHTKLSSVCMNSKSVVLRFILHTVPISGREQQATVFQIYISR